MVPDSLENAGFKLPATLRNCVTPTLLTFPYLARNRAPSCQCPRCLDKRWSPPFVSPVSLLSLKDEQCCPGYNVHIPPSTLIGLGMVYECCITGTIDYLYYIYFSSLQYFTLSITFRIKQEMSAINCDSKVYNNKVYSVAT